MKTAIINQFRGIGDILFTVPIARKYISDGYKVLYPTIFPEIAKHFRDIFFIEKAFVNIDYENKNVIKNNGITVIPLRFADSIMNTNYENCMSAKYRMLDIPLKLWRTLTWERDIKAENRLFHDVLKLNESSNYNLVNNFFLSDFSMKTTIAVKNGMQNIEMKRIEGFTLLDWGMVIENAATIHTVGTSFIYILEIMELKAKELHLYKREGFENTHGYYDYLLQKNYIFH